LGSDLDSADSVAKAASGSNVQPQDSNYFDQKLHSCSFIYQATILDGEKTVYQVIGNGAQPFRATGNPPGQKLYSVVYLGGTASPTRNTDWGRVNPTLYR